MSIDASYVISNSILAVLESVVCLICILIYKNTKGASVAYKMWALSTCFLLVSASIGIICGLTLECNNYSSKTINEIHVLLRESFAMFGYFFLPVGVLYLSKDMGVGQVNEKTIQKMKTIFFGLMIAVPIFLAALIPFFVVTELVSFIYKLFSLSIWILTLYYYKDLYSVLKSTNICWSLLYLGVIAAMMSDLSLLVSFMVSSFFFVLLVSQLFMAMFFISGFFKLAKMVEAF